MISVSPKRRDLTFNLFQFLDLVMIMNVSYDFFIFILSVIEDISITWSPDGVMKTKTLTT